MGGEAAAAAPLPRIRRAHVAGLDSRPWTGQGRLRETHDGAAGEGGECGVGLAVVLVEGLAGEGVEGAGLEGGPEGAQLVLVAAQRVCTRDRGTSECDVGSGRERVN